MDPTAARVTAIHDVGPDAIALDIETPEEFSARPGQFVKVSLDIDGESHSRFYTISSPDTRGTFEITVGIDPEGEVGPSLETLDTGEEITIAGPFGSAYYEDESRTVVLAGGPGVGPAVGIAERTLTDGGETAVVYRDEEPIHRDRLDTLAAAGATVELVSSEEDLAEPVERALTGADGEQVFVYGFAAFLDAATSALDATEGDSAAAKMESFG